MSTDTTWLEGVGLDTSLATIDRNTARVEWMRRGPHAGLEPGMFKLCTVVDADNDDDDAEGEDGIGCPSCNWCTTADTISSALILARQHLDEDPDGEMTGARR